MSILTIMTTITIFRIVVCFLRWHECTVKRFGPGVSLWCGWEKEQNPCMPNWIWRHHEGSMVETRRPNHDEVQAVTAIKRLRRKRVAVNPLHTIVILHPPTCTRCSAAPQQNTKTMNNQNNYNKYNNHNIMSVPWHAPIYLVRSPCKAKPRRLQLRHQMHRSKTDQQARNRHWSPSSWYRDVGWYRHGSELCHGTLPQGRRRWWRCMWRRNVRSWRCACPWRFITRFFERLFGKIVIRDHCERNTVMNNNNNSNKPNNCNNNNWPLSFQIKTII
jgi:hypothetical protein